jgi:hypothetical protein
VADDIIPPISPRTRRRGAREALIGVFVAAAILVLCQGPSIRRSGERLDPGPIRTAVLAVGRPAAWIGERLPLADAAHTLTAWLSPDEELAGGKGGFSAVASQARGVAPVTPDAFDPADLGAKPPPRRALRTLLVTGDSMSMPLDSVLARRLQDGRAIQVIRDPKIGTGISKSDLLDWGKLAVRQAGRDRPDAVVVFIGANEGFDLPAAGGRTVKCCGAPWAALYATRVRTMMDTYRRGGRARVYWLTLPMPRDPRRQAIARVVNAAVRAAAAPYRAQVRVLDMATLFTPGGRYRDDMAVGGEERLVRQADGIHLNEAGSELAADAVLEAAGRDFGDLP